MASITIKVNGTSGVVSASNARTAIILTKCLEAWDGPVGGTVQERVDFVVGKVRDYLVEVARGENRRAKMAVAQTEADDEIASINLID